MHEVRFTTREWRLAALSGVDRRIMDQEADRAEKYGAPVEGGWSRDIDGIIGEWALAKALDVYFPGADPALYGKGDIGRWQVRTTWWRRGCLILHDDDKDDAPYVLVILSPFRAVIFGWMMGAEGKQPRYWRSKVDRPAYFIEQRDQHPWSLDLVMPSWT
jgi:hypothetical protein